MIHAPRQSRPHRRLRRGLTLAEASLSIIVVGVMLVAALNTVGATKTTRAKAEDRGRGSLLAQDLMAEILAQNYTDPTSGLGSWGIESGETGDGSRALWDDVDDYDNLSESPPHLKDGSEIAGLTGWQRTVDVAWVTIKKFKIESASETGVKLITVTVKSNGVEVATLTALRTNALTWIEEP